MKSDDFDIGFAFDGDADRVGICLKGGKVLSGEEVIYYLTKYYSGEKIVITKMANMALYNLLKSENIDCIITDVGEKPVLTALLENNLRLGCENNGHYIMLDLTTTSDGILAASRILSMLSCLGELKSNYKPYYQVQKNIAVKDKNYVMQSTNLKNAIDVCDSLIMESGRILVRPSGTENLIRILVEGFDKKIVDEIAETISKTIENI